MRIRSKWIAYPLMPVALVIAFLLMIVLETHRAISWLLEKVIK